MYQKWTSIYILLRGSVRGVNSLGSGESAYFYAKTVCPSFLNHGALLSFNHASTTSLDIPTRTFKVRRCASSGGYLAVQEKNGSGVISEVLDSWYRYLNNAYATPFRPKQVSFDPISGATRALRVFLFLHFSLTFRRWHA